MKKMNKDSSRYYKDLKVLLPFQGKKEKQLLKGFQKSLKDLNEEDPDITYQNIEEHLGNPTEIMQDYYAGIEYPYLMRQLRIKGIVQKFICCLVILAVIAFAVNVGLAIKSYYDFQDSLPVYEKTIIY